MHCPGSLNHVQRNKQVQHKKLINCSLIRGSMELCPVIAVKIHLLICIFLVKNGKNFVKTKFFFLQIIVFKSENFAPAAHFSVNYLIYDSNINII